MSYLNPAASTLSLAVNLETVAALRDAGRSGAPDLATIARVAQEAGASCVVLPPEVQDEEVIALSRVARVRMPMPADPIALERALELRPQEVSLDDVDGDMIEALHGAGIDTIVVVDTEQFLIDLAARGGARAIELRAWNFIIGEPGAAADLLGAIRMAVDLGLRISLGQGIDFINAPALAAQQDISELHIGHALAARAFEAGWGGVVWKMVALMHRARAARKA